MTRLLAFLMSLGVLALVSAVCVVAVRPNASPALIASLAGPLVPLSAGVWAALKERA